MAHEDVLVAVSPRHSVILDPQYAAFVARAPSRDFVVRTIAQRQANGMPLMSAEIVIAGGPTREQFPLATKYPLHFKKTYFAGRLHGDPQHEFERQMQASRLIDVPPAIGFGAQVFRTCLVPGKPYASLSPFQVEPETANLRHARELDLATAVGLWKLAEQALERLLALHRGGLAHGDAELHNFVVCPAPLEIVPIDFECAVERGTLSEPNWESRCMADLDPLLRQAVFLQCSLGAQPGQLGELALRRIDKLFRDAERFRREIGHKLELSS